jgi:hypothetical protein
VKKSVVWLSKKLRLLFDFHQPHFRHLDCIDLVLENKLLLLVSWDSIHASKICIHPGKIVYRNPTSAAICRLPANTDSVDIILRNVWRSKKMTFWLKRIALDQQTLLHLDELFMKRLTLIVTSTGPAIPSINFKQLKPTILLSMYIPVINISINQLQLNDYAP